MKGRGPFLHVPVNAESGACAEPKGHTLGAPIKFNEAKRKLAAKMLSQKVRKRVRGKTVWRKRYTQKAIAEALKISVQTLIVYLREKKLKVKR